MSDHGGLGTVAPTADWNGPDGSEARSDDWADRPKGPIRVGDRVRVVAYPIPGRYVGQEGVVQAVPSRRSSLHYSVLLDGAVTAVAVTANEIERLDPADQPIEFDLTEQAEDLINHPKHYTSHPSGVEPIEITQHLSFCLGNVVKYIMRHKAKGDPIGDLKKARWYLDKELERISR